MAVLQVIEKFLNFAIFILCSGVSIFNSATVHSQALCTMPRGQSGRPRIGTFVCPSNPTTNTKQAKEPTFPPVTKGELIADD